MKTKQDNTSKLLLIIGIAGTLAGISLLFSENYLIGVFGSIASASLVVKYYKDNTNS